MTFHFVRAFFEINTINPSHSSSAIEQKQNDSDVDKKANERSSWAGVEAAISFGSRTVLHVG
jgi:hypothetical protein